MKHLKSFWVIFIFAAISACSLQKDIEVDLPYYSPQLVVEGYLEVGKPIRLTITRSQAFFDSLTTPDAPNATAIVWSDDFTDTLINQVTFDFENGKVYNYMSPRLVTATPNKKYFLSITTPEGDAITATTQLLPKPILDSVYFTPRPNDTTGYLVFKLANPEPESLKYFRLITNVDTTNGPSTTNYYFPNDFGVGDKLVLSTGFSYKYGDTVFIRLFQIEKQYYDYLESLSDASRAAGNPFAQPANIKSAITGGIGVFTALYPTLDTLFIPKKP